MAVAFLAAGTPRLPFLAPRPRAGASCGTNVRPPAGPLSPESVAPAGRVLSPRRLSGGARVIGGGVGVAPTRQICVPRAPAARSGACANRERYCCGSARATAATERSRAFYPGERKGFVEEMRFVAMKLHAKDQAKEGRKEADMQPVGQWEPSLTGYLKFLVNSKAVYDAMESIVDNASHPAYAVFRNTGLERSAKLTRDLEWFKSQGHDIPEPGERGLSYAKYLNEIAEKDPPAFICHFYNVYFAHTAGGRMIGKKVAEKILDGRELEFYKWDGDLGEMMAAVKKKLNEVAKNWTRTEKNHCLKETEKSFQNSGKILWLIIL